MEPSAQGPEAVNGLSGLMAVAAGGDHSLGLRSDGTVIAWYRYVDGQLADSVPRPSPRLVEVQGLTDIVAIAAGAEHSLALTGAGDVWTWGHNDRGPLGDRTPASQAIPTRVRGLSDVTAIAAGAGHSLAVRQDGSVWSWGDNSHGQIGRIEKDTRTPAPIEGLSHVVAVSAGDRHSLALTSDGTLYAWGDNTSGQTGDAWTTSGLRPTQLRGLPDIVAIAAGGSHSLALTSDGRVLAWGDNTFGQLGETAVPASSAPIEIEGFRAVAIAAGLTHSLARDDAGSVWEWGGRDISKGRAPRRILPAPTIATGNTIATPTFRTPRDITPGPYVGSSGAITAGGEHSLAIKPDGTLYGWGSNQSGQLGIGSSGNDQVTPVSVLTGVNAVAGGGSHTLILKTDGTVWGSGLNTSGQLGDRSTTNRTTPVQAWQLSGVTAIAAGETHSLALKSDGTVYSWGGNAKGQLGLGDQTNRNKPTKITSLSGIMAIAAGREHSMALKNDFTVLTWGSNQQGQIGNGTSGSNQLTPLAVSGLTGVSSIAAGGWHSLVVLNTGTAKAWGNNASGQIGNGESGNIKTTPTPVSNLTSLAALAGGANHTIALKNDGTVWSWGANDSGQLGDGTPSPHSLPAQVTGLPTMVAISAGWSHNLALEGTGVVWAWGGNSRGQIGDGTRINRLNPVPISDAGFAWKVATPTFSLASGEYGASLSVAVATATTGATIHYTTNGLDPTEADPVPPGGTVSVQTSLTLKARAFKTGMPASNVAAAVYNLRVSVSLSPGGGTYSIPQNVTVTSTSGAEVHYTTNGAEPTEADTLLPSGQTVPVGATMTLKVKAWKAGWLPSYTATATYTMKVATPSLSPGGGNYSSTQSVQVSTNTPDAEIHYTTSGVEPTQNDPPITSGGTVLVDRSMTLKAKAWRTGWTTSDTSAPATYFLNLGSVATPTMAPPGGTYTSAQAVTLASATSGATIRYTVDNTEPGWSSPIYTAPLMVSANTTLKAKAYKADYAPSATATAVYVINTGSVATPSFSPGTGTYVRARVVTVTCDTPGATIHYTTSGADPTENDLVVASGSTVQVNESLMLKAKAWLNGSPSGVARADYSITGAVAAGANHTLALKPDGTVWSWGDNSHGQLGDGTIMTRSSPVQVKVSPTVALTDIVAIAAGALHSLAVKADGTAWSWGYNFNGQLGNNSTTESRYAVQVAFPPPTTSPVVAVAADRYNGPYYSFSLALKADGTTWSWGYNVFYELGDGTQIQRPTPVQVQGLTGVTRIAAGGYHGLALKTDGAASGTVWAWGSNSNGAIGDGTMTNRPTPVSGLTGATDVAAGLFHSMALKADGTVFAWGGDNVSALLGDGTTARSLSPVRTAALTKVRSVTGGTYHSVAAPQDGSVWTWGRYGNNDPESAKLFPVPKPGLSGIAAVASSGNHSVALGFDGSVWTWGENLHGEIGDGTTGSFRNTPFRVPGFGNDWLGSDPDGDGLPTWRELEVGSDPTNPDTNGDGILDGDAVSTGLSPTNPDLDGDGLTNAAERLGGTDPFVADTDGDGVADGADCFPLDASRWQCPAPTPGDTTPPVITLTEPTNAVLISSVPPQ